MSFSSDLKAELAHTRVESRCCAIAEIAAALRAGGIAFRGAGRYELSITASDGATVRHYFAILKKYWGIAAQIRMVTTSALGEKTSYQLIINEEHGRTVLKSVRLWDEKEFCCIRPMPHTRIVSKDCCKQAFLRSAFMLCGTITNPETGYALEFATPTDEYASFLIEIMKNVGILAKKACRKNKFVVYLKRAESVSDLIAMMGAGNTMLKLEEIRVRKDVSNDVHRLINCDNNNIVRSTDAARRQLEDILLLEEAIGLKNLPETLSQLAQMRMDAPEAALSELGNMLNPPIGKSGVNARMRRISALAQKVRDEEKPK